MVLKFLFLMIVGGFADARSVVNVNARKGERPVFMPELRSVWVVSN